MIFSPKALVIACAKLPLAVKMQLIILSSDYTHFKHFSTSSFCLWWSKKSPLPFLPLLYWCIRDTSWSMTSCYNINMEGWKFDSKQQINRNSLPPNWTAEGKGNHNMVPFNERLRPFELKHSKPYFTINIPHPSFFITLFPWCLLYIFPNSHTLWQRIWLKYKGKTKNCSVLYLNAGFWGFFWSEQNKYALIFWESTSTVCFSHIQLHEQLTLGASHMLGCQPFCVCVYVCVQWNL